jgi:hypothetical protein
MDRDIFLCHASEDKSAVVRPLASAFERDGFSVWLDEAEIAWGDSITSKVNEGLKLSRYVVVVLSRAFLAKNWPKQELWAVLSIEARTGQVKVLPILVGTHADVEYFLAEFPLLDGKRYLLWDGAPQPVVREFRDLIGKHLPNDQQGTDLLTCGLCRTPFERGVRVCLGCRGTIVYGQTDEESLQARQLGIGVVLLFFMGLLLFIPNALWRHLGLSVRDLLDLSTARRSYAASWIGGGSPNFASSFVLV